MFHEQCFLCSWIKWEHIWFQNQRGFVALSLKNCQCKIMGLFCFEQCFHGKIHCSWWERLRMLQFKILQQCSCSCMLKLCFLGISPKKKVFFFLLILNLYLLFQAQATICVSKALKWWKKTLKPNMIEIHSAQELVHSLLNAGDSLVVVDFYSPGCGGCKALHPKVCLFLFCGARKVIFLNSSFFF